MNSHSERSTKEHFRNSKETENRRDANVKTPCGTGAACNDAEDKAVYFD